MTDINDIKRELEALTAKVAAYEAEKAPKRNWPERIEAGMCFVREDVRYVLFGKWLTNIESGVAWSTSGDPFAGDQSEFDYLGKMDLTIRTEAREPTGAELVGKAVHVCDSMNGVWHTESCGAPIFVEKYDPESIVPYKVQSGNRWRFARLAR